MSLEGPATSALFTLESLLTLIRAGILSLAVAYFFFSLIVVRQVNMMTETVITEAGSVLRALAILHAGVALGAIILFIGFLFG